jgi:hypothetical protein
MTQTTHNKEGKVTPFIVGDEGSLLGLLERDGLHDFFTHSKFFKCSAARFIHVMVSCYKKHTILLTFASIIDC